MKKALSFRPTHLEDASYLQAWLSEPGVLRWFPMIDAREVEDAVRIWVGYSKMLAGLTAEWEGKPCGMANLYIQPYKKLKHTSLFSIIVDQQYRNKGVGQALILELERWAKEKFAIEILHLEVYEGNPARRLYERLGYKYSGEQRHFIKEDGKYATKVFMQKEL